MTTEHYAGYPQRAMHEQCFSFHWASFGGLPGIPAIVVGLSLRLNKHRNLIQRSDHQDPVSTRNSVKENILLIRHNYPLMVSLMNICRPMAPLVGERWWWEGPVTWKWWTQSVIFSCEARRDSAKQYKQILAHYLAGSKSLSFCNTVLKPLERGSKAIIG